MMLCLYGIAQEKVDLSDLSFFQSTGDNWKIVSSLKADLEEDKTLKTKKGTGVLVNLPGKKHASNIESKMLHGDMDLELEFMMAKGSNSGIYLQARYEVQLLDSWGVTIPKFGDCGGIYERWDEAKPDGQKGYEGHAPRMNVCKAPGLWQHLKIKFRAAAFNDYGEKVSNARFVSIHLNGQLIHENLELTGPTRGGRAENSEPGPLFIQGDHGPVAFRNIRYKIYGKGKLQLENLRYEHYEITSDALPDFKNLKLIRKDKAPHLTHKVTQSNGRFALRFKGDFEAKEAGDYFFDMDARGWAYFKIDDKDLLPYGAWRQADSIFLEKGQHSFELLYLKTGPWFPNGLGLYVSGPNISNQALHAPSSLSGGGPNSAVPILLGYEAKPSIMRSFRDFPLPEGKNHRITHAISVGSADRLNYTFDPKSAALAQIWRGDFLDATPMWSGRGDGSSVPLGAILNLGVYPELAKLDQLNEGWPIQMEEGGYRYKGYQLDQEGWPTFRYHLHGVKIQDQIKSVQVGKQIQRKLKREGSVASMYFKLAQGQNIEEQAKGLYSIDQQYFIQVSEETVVIFRESAGKQELLVDFSKSDELTYQLLW